MQPAQISPKKKKKLNITTWSSCILTLQIQGSHLKIKVYMVSLYLLLILTHLSLLNLLWSLFLPFFFVSMGSVIQKSTFVISPLTLSKLCYTWFTSNHASAPQKRLNVKSHLRTQSNGKNTTNPHPQMFLICQRSASSWPSLPFPNNHCTPPEHTHSFYLENFRLNIWFSIPAET